MDRKLKVFCKGFILLLFVLSRLVNNSNASHIVGGELYYDCLGTNTYRLTLKIYRDCLPGSVGFDNPSYLSIWDREPTSNLLDTATIGFPGAVPISLVSLDTCYTPTTNLCFEEAVYVTVVTLPASISGYLFVYQRCCRSFAVQSILDPGEQGMTIFEAVPASAPCNNSPRFNYYPAFWMCVNQPFQFDNSATDADGDSLVYRLCEAYNGANLGVPQPIQTLPPPYTSVPYIAPFSGTNPINGSPAMSIDPVTGFISITPTQLGNFIIGVCCDEYRGGVIIGTHSREFPLHIVNCTLESDCISTVGMINSGSMEIFVYPNPASAMVKIESPIEVNIQVYDIVGKLVYQSTTVNQTHNINLSEWTMGVYTYRVYTSEGMSTGKFIKE